MKKLILMLLLVPTLQARPPRVPLKNAINEIKKAPTLTLKDLEAWDFASIAGWSAASGFGGWMVSTGLSLLVRASYFTLAWENKEWNGRGWNQTVARRMYVRNNIGAAIEAAGTATAAALGAYYAYKSRLPQNFWTENDINLLDIVLTSATDEELLTRIDQFFLREKFGRPVAFMQLLELLEKLTRVKTLYTRAGTINFAPALAAIEDSSNAIDRTMLLIKSQATWLTESNAHTLESIKHGAQNQAMANNIALVALMTSDR